MIGETSKDNPTGINPENENHLGLPEVQEALQSGVGFDTRKSESTGKPTFGEARVLGDYVLRAAMPVTEMDEATRKAEPFMLAGVCLGELLWRWYPLSAPGTLCAQCFGSLRLPERSRPVISRAGYRSTTPMNRPAGPIPLTGWRIRPKKAFSELTEQGHQLEAVLQGMDDGVLAVDQYDNILLFNERVSRAAAK